MHYKDTGKGEAVVLIHGFMENGKMWGFANELSKDYRLIIPDLLGHGKTESISDTHTMEMQATQVVKILDELGIETANFIGHSMGGYISLVIARDYPERVKKLGLFFSNSLPDSDDKKEQRRKAIDVVVENRESFIRHGVRGLFASNRISELDKEIDFARGLAEETPTEGIQAALRGMIARGNTTGVLEKVDYPVQIILGEYDPAIAVDLYKKHIPNKENIKIDVLPVGHMGHLEAPKESLEILKDFLKK